jgi:hypothetical protein
MNKHTPGHGSSAHTSIWVDAARAAINKATAR